MSENPEIALRLPISSLVTIIGALSTGRYFEVAELIAEIRRQAFAQLDFTPVAAAPRTAAAGSESAAVESAAIDQPNSLPTLN